MKKIFAGILSGALLFGGIGLLSDSFVALAEEAVADNSKTTVVSNISDLQTALATDDNSDSICDYSSIKLGSHLKGTEISEGVYEDLVIDIANFPTFKGTLDGDGYSIRNLKITSSASSQTYFGLIPQANDATIQNLKLTGNLTFDLSNMPSTGGYIGGFVGLGTDVLIDTCEIELDTIQEAYSYQTGEEPNIQTVNDVRDIVVDKEIHFGSFAGRLVDTSSATKPRNMQNCVAYFGDVYSNSKLLIGEVFNFQKMVKAKIGGLVGSLDSAQIVNSLCFGNISIDGEDLTAVDGVNQYVGGIVGQLQGTRASVRNACFDGIVQTAEGYSLSSLYSGAILGGTSSSFTLSNIRYNYFSQSDPIINPVGDGSISIADATSSNMLRLSAVDSSWTKLTSAILQTETYPTDDTKDLFDGELGSGDLGVFDFAYTWDATSSGKILLQRFETFNFTIDEDFFEIILNQKPVLKDAYFSGEYGKDNEKSKSFRYGEPVSIEVYSKNDPANEDYTNWLENLKIYQNTDTEVNVEVLDVPNNEGKGWYFVLTANASTAGKYSFSMAPISFQCDVGVESKEKGGIYLEGSTESSAVESRHLDFNCFSPSKTVIATDYGIYAFRCWGVSYLTTDANQDKDGDGFEDTVVECENLTSPTLTITYSASGSDDFSSTDGNACTISQKVKLVALYIDDPINVGFNLENGEEIVGITMAGREYVEGEQLPLAKSGTVVLEVTVKAGYELDVEKLMNDIKIAINDVNYQFPDLFQSTPQTLPDGSTLYKFNIDMSVIDYSNISSLVLSLETQVSKDGQGGNLLWLAIVLPIVVVLGAGGTVLGIWLARRKNGKGGRGGKGGKGGATKARKVSANAKIEDYTDYYV